MVIERNHGNSVNCVTNLGCPSDVLYVKYEIECASY